MPPRPHRVCVKGLDQNRRGRVGPDFSHRSTPWRRSSTSCSKSLNSSVATIFFSREIFSPAHLTLCQSIDNIWRIEIVLGEVYLTTYVFRELKGHRKAEEVVSHLLTCHRVGRQKSPDEVGGQAVPLLQLDFSRNPVALDSLILWNQWYLVLLL